MEASALGRGLFRHATSRGFGRGLTSTCSALSSNSPDRHHGCRKANVTPKNLTPSVSNNQDKTTNIMLIMSVKKPTIVRTNTPIFPRPERYRGI